MRASPCYLLLDDDEDDRFLLQAAFNEVGESLIATQTHRQFFALLDELNHKKNLPALVILDHNMPELDGAQVLVTLKADPVYCLLPVLMYSTGMGKQMCDHLLSLGAQACLLKPTTMSEFTTFVQTAVQLIH